MSEEFAILSLQTAVDILRETLQSSIHAVVIHPLKMFYIVAETQPVCDTGLAASVWFCCFISAIFVCE